VDLKRSFEQGRNDAEEQRASTQRRHAASAAKATEFGQNAAERLREMLTLKDGTAPDIVVNEPIVRETSRELRATVRVSGSTSVGQFRVTTMTEAFHTTIPAGYAPMTQLGTLEAVRGTVSTGNGPPEQFEIPASCNYVTPYFHANKDAFDRELQSAVQRLGEKNNR
jgi:hypothetical protein